MKKILLILGLISFNYLANAQYALNKGKSQLNAGVGLSGLGAPLYVGLDYGVHKDISIGGELSFRSYYNNYGIGILGNANYHFNWLLAIPKEFDFYAGLNLGYYVWTGSTVYVNSRGVNGLGIGLQVGGRYYFTPKFGINLEFNNFNVIGGGKFGITYKF
jgi:hypothetical protein